MLPAGRAGTVSVVPPALPRHRATFGSMSPSRRVRLCLKDLFHQDVVEMIERETRRYGLWEVLSPEDPDFAGAYKLLWDAFGAQGEMERVDAIRSFLEDDPYDPIEANGTFCRYFLIVARDEAGEIRGVRDGSVLVNQAYDPDLCVVYLSHIYMRPEARGTVLSYWLRIAPVEIAVQYLADLHARGRIRLPAPDAPSRYFGMRIDLAAEMEYFTPEDRISWQRLLFYGRGGFDAINPRHFPYRQPDFRDPELIRKSGNMPMPFMVLLRRIGFERQAVLPLEEARGVLRLLYDDFATHCAPEFLDNSLQIVLDRLEARAKKKSFVELLPLPTGSRDLHRLKRLFRYTVFSRYYRGSPEVKSYLASGIRETLRANPRWLDEELAKIAEELDRRPHFVYANRDKGYTWEGDVAREAPEAGPEPENPDLTEDVLQIVG
jgi:hypothetical protein